MSEARAITMSLGGTWRGSSGNAPCPVCQPERRPDQRGLALEDGANGILLFCHKSNCKFIDILKAADVARRSPNATDFAIKPPPQRRRADLPSGTSQRATVLWEGSVAISGTPAETYLRYYRGITAPLCDALRFNPGTWHGPGKRDFPAMIARIDGGPEFSVSRTYLAADGGPFAHDQRKMMCGASRGGHVTLIEGTGPLVIAEGIETALSLASGLADVTNMTLWAALTAPNLRAVILPANPGDLIIATDGDNAGRTAGKVLAERARGLGWTVSFLHAPDGKDWNDVLKPKTT